MAKSDQSSGFLAYQQSWAKFYRSLFLMRLIVGFHLTLQFSQ